MLESNVNLGNKLFNEQYSKTENQFYNSRKRKFSGLSFNRTTNRKEFPNIYTSSNNTANLYLNEKNYSFTKKKKAKNNNYFDKEQLFQNLIKLQISFNELNQKYKKQKIENDKQSKEIERNNKFLNSMKINNLRNLEILDEKEKNLENLNSYQTLQSTTSPLYSGHLKLNEEKYNLNSTLNYGIKIKKKTLRKLYDELYIECKNRDLIIIKFEKEMDKFRQENDIIKFSKETLISNLKRQIQKLDQENNEKDKTIAKLKKNMKCSKYTELFKENEVLNLEMEKLKNKFRDSLKKINEYKEQENEIKELHEIIKKKDFKIKTLQLQVVTLSNNSDEVTKKLKDEIIIKEKKIKKQERIINKNIFEKYSFNQNQNSIEDINNFISKSTKNNNKICNLNLKEISEKYPELFQLYIEMKHKGIKSYKDYEEEIFNKMNDINTLDNAKVIYYDLLINYFNINNSDDKSKNIILSLANKEFIPNKTIYDIKNKQIQILNELFVKGNKNNNLNGLKEYILKNSLDEKLRQTFNELDHEKLGYITFEEMKNVINNNNLGEYSIDILFLTKSEIFNVFNYFNLLILFENEGKKDKNGENITEEKKVNSKNNEEEKKTENDNNKNGKNKEEEKKEENDKNITIHNNSQKVNLEDEKKEKKEKLSKEDNIGKKNGSKNEKEETELDKKLKDFVHKIKREGCSPSNYIVNLKESISINNKIFSVINLKNLKKFFKEKNIELDEKDILNLSNMFKLNEEYRGEINIDDFINYEVFIQKLLNIIQNDSNDEEDFLENIPNLEVEGMD